MTDDGESDGDEDSVEATEVLVGDNSTDDGCCVGPERVEGTNTERGTLAHTEGAGLTLRARVFTSSLDYAVNDGQLLLDEVGVCSQLVVGGYVTEREHTQHLATVVTETLAKFDKRDGKDLPWDLARDTTQCLQFLLSGCLSNEIGLEFNRRGIKVMACGGRRRALLASKNLLLIHFVERRSNLGLVAEGHVDLVGTAGSSHDGSWSSSVDVNTREGSLFLVHSRRVIGRGKLDEGTSCC